MNEILNNIVSAEQGGLIDLGKALRKLLTSGGGGGSSTSSANISEFLVGVEENKYISPSTFFAAQAAHTLTDTDNVVVNMNNGFNFLLTLGGNRAITNPINYKIGQSGVFIIQQNATGGFNPTWGTSWKFMSGPPTIPQSPHAWILFRYFVQANDVVRMSYEASGGTALNAATVEEIREGLEALKYISPDAFLDAHEIVEVIEDDPVWIDFAEGINFKLTLTDDREIDSPLDQRPGRGGDIIIEQDGTGGHDVTWHAHWKFPQGQTTLANGAGQRTVFRYFVEAIGSIHLTPSTVFASREDFWLGTSRAQSISPFIAFDSQEAIDLGSDATVTPNFSLGINFNLNLIQNTTIANPASPKANQSGLICIKQSGTGGNQVSWGNAYRFIAGLPPSIPTDVDLWTVVPYFVLSLSPLTILCSSVDAATSSSGTAIQPATNSEVRAGVIDSKYISPAGLAASYAPSVLVDGPSIVPNLTQGKNFIVTLGGNRFIEAITNQRLGASGYFVVIQDGTGGRQATWSSSYSFSNGIPALPQSPGTWVMFPYHIQDIGVVRCITPQSSVFSGIATVSQYRAATLSNVGLSPAVVVQGNAPVVLVEEENIPINFSTGINFSFTLTANRGILNPSSQIAGMEGKFIIYQDGTGGWDLTWGSNYIYNSLPYINPDPGSFSVIPYYVEAPGRVLVG